MDNNQRKVLEMLAEGKITVAEAERLMSLIRPESGAAASGSFASGEAKEEKAFKVPPKYLRVEVVPNPDNPDSSSERVNIRVPMSLLRAGIKLTSVIPPSAYNQVDSALKDKGMQFDLRNIKPEDLEELLRNLGDLEIDVHNGQQKVHVYAE
jgi:hypothetical protein